MSLNVPSGSEGALRMCPMKGVKIDQKSLELVRLGKKQQQQQPGLVRHRWETPHHIWRVSG